VSAQELPSCFIAVEPPARRSRSAPAKLVVAMLAITWLAVGAAGAYRYVDQYWMYRGFPAPVTPAGTPAGSARLIHFFSPALHQRREYEVYLPAGYARAARSGRRFPVLYLLHAPPGRVDGFLQAGAMGVRQDILVARHQIRPMLLVIPFGKTRAYANDTEWANARAGNYESFVLDVVRSVDKRFAAYRDRRHRGIAGLSEGGYGALNVGLHHLHRFSVIESWSGYYAQAPTASFTGASAAQLAANSPAAYVGSMAPRIRRLGLRVWLYQGTRDQIKPWRIRTFARRLHDAGAAVRYGFFPGGHDWGLWRHEMGRMLRAASGWFAQAPRLSARDAGRLVGLGRPATAAELARLRARLLARCHARHLAPGLRRPRMCARLQRRAHLAPGARHPRGGPSAL
jgi:enterochelin esterase-like enzyme